MLERLKEPQLDMDSQALLGGTTRRTRGSNIQSQQHHLDAEMNEEEGGGQHSQGARRNQRK
jgi:hypothetical protein